MKFEEIVKGLGQLLAVLAGIFSGPIIAFILGGGWIFLVFGGILYFAGWLVCIVAGSFYWLYKKIL